MELKQNFILPILKSVVFLILGIIAILILSEVFKQFISESSTFKQYEKPIKEFPTITFCTPSSTDNSYKIFEYGKDFNIIYYNYMENQETDYMILEKGIKNEINSMNSSKMEVYLDQILRLGSGNGNARCFKITTNISKEISSVKETPISFNFSSLIPQNELSDLEFYITSEKNSHGIALSEWMDGEELTIRIEKVNIFQTNNIINILYLKMCSLRGGDFRNQFSVFGLYVMPTHG